ncbi:hypothetical protein H7849_21365 [Alloacidobacterium dinghuense]|uniref:Uncharacterized protein n=1 Tax=Alloacidobacterium dinghuense TaxID=2763107 RepID=A0A7G8BGC0_9BACT|nr:hypothetical protein [Alloacidobacterium dinghuense]QNI31590.1 hypothetical protein H7849_21365 [Alloacidobacterium dinghuense]
MNPIDKLVSDALGDFRKVAALADAAFIADTITVEIMPKPHKPPKRLPVG